MKSAAPKPAVIAFGELAAWTRGLPWDADATWAVAASRSLSDVEWGQKAHELYLLLVKHEVN